jgi:hypothetical protein
VGSDSFPMSVKDKTMTAKRIENALALAAALIVLIGVSAAASTAFAAAPIANLDIDPAARISLLNADSE